MKWPLLILLPSLVLALDSPPGSWNEPFVIPLDTEKVAFLGYDISSKEIRVSMWEEMPVPFKLVQLNYNGPQSDIKITGSGQSGASLAFDDGKHYIVINNKMDYEIESQRNLLVFLEVEKVQVFVAIDLLNILDNAPVMSSAGPCPVDEGLENFLADCEYTVFHADGFVADGILGSKTNVLDFELPEAYTNLFQFEEDTGSSDDYNKKFKLRILEKLDYTLNAVYSFQVTVYDLDRTHNATQNIVVQVNNVESRRPIFTRPFTTTRIDEKSPYSINVTAIDGDTGLNKPICYELETEQEKYAKYFSIGKETGELQVEPINRDLEQEEFYQFTIVAYKCHNRAFNLSNVGAIILNDLNDNPPVFTVEPTLLKFWENTPMELPFEQFTIDDIDLGPHATYSVKLQERVADELLDDGDSFSITPRSGYQQVNFTLTVVNPTALDYEDLDRQQFELIVTAKDPDNTTEQILNIELLNWNDEVPVFEPSDTYSIHCNETEGEGYILTTIVVTDRDIGDSVELEILSNIQRDMDVRKLDSTEEKRYSFQISLNRDGVFDWDIASEVVVQLQASDTLQTAKNEPIHRVYAQLIITVGDVNNKPPTIVLPRGSITIEENSAPGTVASIEGEDAIIIGTDPDSTAELVFSIDWAKSYAVKTGVTVTSEVFENCLVIVVDATNPNRVVGKLVVNPGFDQAKINETLDYEAYETLFLNIKLEDKMQEIPPGDTETILVIQIGDVNDNAPEFVGSTLIDERFVQEEATSGIVGTITAIDRDGPLYNKITYSLRALDTNHEGWITINPDTGLLSVGASVTNPINCDVPITFVIPLEITITDQEFTERGQISINITDTNNRTPQFTTLEDDDLVIEIFEKPDAETVITQLQAKDLDRDEPFHTAAFEFDLRTYPDLQRYFDVVQSSTTEDDRMINIAIVRVRPNGEKLDRDAGPVRHQVKVIAIDNPNSSGRRNSNDTTFTLVLLDINDNEPKMPELGELTLSENTDQGVSIVEVFAATDRDDPATPNAKINYAILGISAADSSSQGSTGDQDQAAIDTLFTVVPRDDYSAHFRTGRNLKGFYGTWAVQIEACDRGDEYELVSNSTKLCTRAIYTVQVEPFNYMAPVIDVPKADERIRLRFGEQSNGQPLVNTQGSVIPNFSATDTDGGSYGEVTFSLAGRDENGQDHTYFQLIRIDRHQARLVVPNVDAIEARSYQVTVLAVDGGGREATSVNVVIAFINMTGDPEFPEDSSPFETDFTENEEGLEEEREIPQAIDPKNADLPPEEQEGVFYFIDREYGNSSHLFTLDGRTLRLTQMIDREEFAEHWISVIATNNEAGPVGVVPANSRARLTIHVKVNDVNDNPPKFKADSYSAGITSNDYPGKVLFYVVAEDPDEDDVISYTINEGTLEVQGENLPTAPFPFALERYTGRLTLVVQMTDRMKGFFTFNVVATDLVDHTDTVQAKIFIIAESNRVKFVFLNKLDDVDQPEIRDFLEQEFSEHYDMQCSIDDVVQGSLDSGRSSDDDSRVGENLVTDVRAHFMRDNEAVEAVVIQQRSNDRVFVTNLKTALSARNLLLQDVPVSSAEAVEENEELLQIILIVVASALGVMCVILLVAFCIKIRSLKRELKALSATDFGSIASDINGGRKVPTTNLFSIEGSNPVLNDSEFPKSAFDDVSVQSYESDFLGIDNDMFANNRKDSINPALMEHIRQRSLNPMVNSGTDEKVPDKAPVLILDTEQDSSTDNPDELKHKF